MGSFSSVHFSIFYLKTKPMPMIYPSSHFPFLCSLFSGKLPGINCLSSSLYFSCSTHPLTLSSWNSVFSALLRLLLLRSLVTFILSKTMATCPYLCYLKFVQHLAGLTLSSSSKHCFSTDFHNIALWCLWRGPTSVSLPVVWLQSDSLHLPYS